MWTPLANSLCELGESPFWHPGEQALYWIDIAGKALLRTRGEIGPDVRVERWTLPQEPGCIAPARSGGLVVALRDGVYRARTWGGPLALIAPALHDVAELRFNDGKCDPHGRFWAGTLHEPKTRHIATLYCLDPHAPGALRLHTKANEALTANGLAFRGETLLWADTPAHSIRIWDWDAATNRLSKPGIWRTFDRKTAPGAVGPAYGGRPDGATLDADDNYWVAMYEGAQVLQLDANGQTQAALPVPAQCPTMPCFGGDDLRTLFITTARKGRPADELASCPVSGHVLYARAALPGKLVDFFDD